jgi:hypothetical protein
MTRVFTAASLTSADSAPAFPLVQAAFPGLEFGPWRTFAARLLGEAEGARSGAVGLRSEARYLCGLLIYRAERHLRHGKVLRVDLFTALDVTGEAAAANALLTAAEAKAVELGCSATHILIDGAQRRLAETIAKAGHRSEAKLFCERLAAAPPN